MVLCGKRTDAQVDSREVDPLSRAQLAPDKDAALDVAACDLDHLQLNIAVVEEQAVGRLDDCGQAREAHVMADGMKLLVLHGDGISHGVTSGGRCVHHPPSESRRQLRLP